MLDVFHPFTKRRLAETLFRLFVLALALLCLAAGRLHACGPYFPNTLLDGGDEVLLAAPWAEFARELELMDLAPSRFAAVISDKSYEQDTLDAEMADLAAALKKAKVPPYESANILQAHQTNRRKLNEYLEADAEWRARRHWFASDDAESKRAEEPAFPVFEDVPGLPAEFADYFAGVVALRRPGATNADARPAWERLLARPAAERKYKSTWAAFMLGKTWEKADDNKAAAYFQMTRELAKQRFADSLGLAVAAIGLEARVEFRRKHFHRAIQFYLQQYAAGDDSAVVSLQWSAQAALEKGGGDLAALAKDADTRSLITAYLISGERRRSYYWSDAPPTNSTATWLRAVESAEVKDVKAGERLALAAYQSGEFEIAQRWVNRARNTPVAQWLQAKLWLRAGNVHSAATLLAKLARQLPVVADGSLTNSTEFADSLRLGSGYHGEQTGTARARILGELGVLRLSRGDFTQALDALLRAGFWMDAAYIAERVLTTDELKTYVDRFWPLTNSETKPEEDDVGSTASTSPALLRENIRYLLARRLTRELRGDLAREYYPVAWQSKYDELATALQSGWNETLPPADRARWLFIAAGIARTNGMELLGTEVEPDWQIHGGQFNYGVSWRHRTTNNSDAKINIASAEELRRATGHKTDPEQRFHYRYQAAFLAWEAAKLMPDNSDDTARVLYTAGSWLKNRDPETADIFYKSLVRRCRKTELGSEADRRRWFPPLDESGRVIREQTAAIEAESVPPDDPVESSERQPSDF